MKQIKVLFGFDEPEFENGVIRYLKSLGYDVESAVKSTKTSVRDFLAGNPDYKVAVLLEVMNNSKVDSVSKYTAEELALLTDERDINIVVVVGESHRGTPYMASLYAAGITSAFYQKGRKGGASVKEIANLVIKKRSRREARVYYGLSDELIKVDFLGNDTFEDYYGCLNDIQYGFLLIERFVNICRYMSASQVADFIRRMPADIIDELKQYEEFFVIIGLLKRAGINMNIKKPKNVCVGLMTPDNMNLVKKHMMHQEENALTVKETPLTIPVEMKEQSANLHHSYSKRNADEIVNQHERISTNGDDENHEQDFFELASSIWGEEIVTSDSSDTVINNKFVNNLSEEHQAIQNPSDNTHKNPQNEDEDVNVDEFIRKGKKKKEGDINPGSNKVLLISVVLIILAIFLIIFGIIVLLI